MKKSLQYPKKNLVDLRLCECRVEGLQAGRSAECTAISSRHWAKGSSFFCYLKRNCCVGDLGRGAEILQIPLVFGQALPLLSSVRQHFSLYCSFRLNKQWHSSPAPAVRAQQPSFFYLSLCWRKHSVCCCCSPLLSLQMPFQNAVALLVAAATVQWELLFSPETGENFSATFWFRAFVASPAVFTRHMTFE